MAAAADGTQNASFSPHAGSALWLRAAIPPFRPRLIANTHMHSPRFQGKTALVTGANSGIGKATAQRLFQEGCRVALLGRDTDELAEAAREIDPEGSRTRVLDADITDLARMNEVVESLPQEWFPLDVVVANAGTNGVWAAFEKLKLEDWKTTIEINLTGTFITLKAAYPHLNRQGS